ncbi:MAG TPA: BamA/TamA family outer membrane protein [Polyangia bacterium]|jgi:Outer membrane protein/protective antigen OMA87|nr:BamA/TamA family outer membrane protein [Polyangia bacterium]
MRFPSPLALLVLLPSMAVAQAPTDAVEPADAALPDGFVLRYTIERIEVRGNHKTRTDLILHEVGLSPGDTVTTDDARVERARLRLLALGYFLDARLSMIKGERRGSAVLVIEVEERGTIILNAVHLGTSDATTLWGGLDVSERNLLGRGLTLGAGFVSSTRPKVDGAEPALAFSLRMAGPPRLHGLLLSGSALFSRGSEFFRARGPSAEPDPADFVALNLRRAGGVVGAGTVLSRTAYLFGEARFEAVRADWPTLRDRDLGQGQNQPIAFLVRDGSSRLGSLVLTLDLDSRSDPVLPRAGRHLVVSLEAATPACASQYTFVKATAQGSLYFPLSVGHVIGVHGLLGGLVGDAPYFDRFFVGDLNLLLPPRAFGINFSTQPSRDFLGTGVADHRYDKLAGRLLVEYAVPLWRRHGLFYRGDAFAALGVFALTNPDDLRRQGASFGQRLPADLTADLGLRLDTYIGIFTLSVANALGRLPL